MGLFSGFKNPDPKKLITQLFDKNPERSERAAKELVEAGVAAVPALVTLLGEKNSSRRNAAAQLLAMIGPEGIPALAQALPQSHPLVQSQIVDILAQIKYPSVVPVLIKALQSQYYTVRSRAAVALGTIGDPQAVPALQKALSDPEADVRGPAALALGKFRQLQSLELLSDLLEDTDFRVRQSAAYALGQTGYAQAVPYLIDAMSDSSWWYGTEQPGTALIKAIELIGQPAVDELIAALSLPEVIIRRNAAALLGRIKSQKAIEPLSMALYDVHYEVSHAAAQSLAAYGAPAAKVLAEALHHPEAWIRQQAILGLERIGNQKVTPILLPMLSDEDRSVRRQTIQSLGALADPRAVSALDEIAHNRSDRELASEARQARDAIRSKPKQD
jgi:HEAT repeat protein